MNETEILKVAERDARAGEYVESVIYQAVYCDGNGNVRSITATSYSPSPSVSNPRAKLFQLVKPTTYPKIDFEPYDYCERN